MTRGSLGARCASWRGPRNVDRRAGSLTRAGARTNETATASAAPPLGRRGGTPSRSTSPACREPSTRGPRRRLAVCTVAASRRAQTTSSSRVRRLCVALRDVDARRRPACVRGRNRTGANGPANGHGTSGAGPRPRDGGVTVILKRGRSTEARGHPTPEREVGTQSKPTQLRNSIVLVGVDSESSSRRRWKILNTVGPRRLGS